MDDFTVDESGRRQTIRYFARDLENPLALGMLIDAGASQRRVFGEVHEASYGFLDRSLRLNGDLPHRDRAFVLQFDSRSQPARALEPPVVNLRSALRFGQTVEEQFLTAKPRGGFLIRGSEALYDAIVAASQYMRRESGRKVCVVVSDGIDYGSESTLSAAIESAQRADTQIHSIQYFDAGAYRPRAVILSPWRQAGAGALMRISEETGGSHFQVSERRTFQSILEQLAAEFRSGYTLGYEPEFSASGYRSIRVGLRRSDLVVQARRGYYAGAREAGMSAASGITGVDPLIVSAGDLVTLSGYGLERSNIAALYLANGDRRVKAAVTEQTATAIRFKVPEGAGSAAWKEGTRRRFDWTIELETSAGDLLNYASFGIATE